MFFLYINCLRFYHKLIMNFVKSFLVFFEVIMIFFHCINGVYHVYCGQNVAIPFTLQMQSFLVSVVQGRISPSPAYSRIFTTCLIYGQLLVVFFEGDWKQKRSMFPFWWYHFSKIFLLKVFKINDVSINMSPSKRKCKDSLAQLFHIRFNKLS